MAKFEREALLKGLELAKAALASKDIVAELTNFWFNGTTALAFNDVIGIEVPCESEFKGGVKGNMVLGFLEHSHTKEIEFGIEKGEEVSTLNLKSGHTKLRLAMMPLKRQIFDIPTTKKGSGVIVTDDFCLALEHALTCVGQDTSIADQIGVTIIKSEAGCTLFATDSKTIVQDTSKMKWTPGRRVLPAIFCEQLLKLRGKEGGELHHLEEAVVFVSKTGARLFSRLVEVKRPLEFEDMVSSLLPKDLAKRKVQLPTKLAEALERALILLGTMPGDHMTMSFDEKELHIEVLVEGAGELKDTIALDSNHPTITRKLDPALIKRNLGLCQYFYLGSNALILRGAGGFHYFVSCSPE